ncbi:MAG: hypothetical protein ACYDAK_12880 [Candidatus Limnocylindrales bacterium]
MPALWTIAANPRKRRARKSSGRKHRTAAQRAATRRMLAANRARRGGAVARNPRRRRAVARVVHHTRVVRRSAKRRSVRRSARRGMSLGGMKAGAFALLKAGAIGAGGALTVDVAMGFVNGYLPATMNTKLNADGSVNYLNYAVKGALAIGLAHFGKRVVSAETANRMATGSFTVMAYEILRPLAVSVMPATMNLGYFAPGKRLAAYANTQPGALRLGKYANVPTGNVHTLRSPTAA